MPIEAPPAIVVDFESEAIKPRPEYPPRPTSVSIRWPGQPVKFLSWGHPCENNCSHATAKDYLTQVWRSDYGVVFHNGKFDIDLAETFFGLPPLPWHRTHDTMFLLFLTDPHAESLGLKPAAVKHLGMDADEQDELHQWIIDHILTTEPGGAGTALISPTVIKRKVPGMFRVTKSKAGAFISLAPGKLVGKYADADTLMTGEMFNLLYPIMHEAGMLEAYQRECKLISILLRNERAGVRVNKNALRRDKNACNKHLTIIDEYVRKMLGAPGLDIGKPDELADALEDAGMVTDWVMTDGGKRSLSKDNIESSISNPHLSSIFQYRSKLFNTMSNFITPWDKMAHANDGYINFSWNQVRTQDNGSKKSKGARTGRLSSSPNAQNATNNPTILVDKPTDGDTLVLPADLLAQVKQLPKIRSYVIPDQPKDGGVIIGVDWSGQELRLLGHFEDSSMLEAYLTNPNLDFHDLAKGALSKMLGLDVKRKHVKALAFCIIYGGGLNLLAKMLSVTKDEAVLFRDAYHALVPGLNELIKALKRRARLGQPITTLGGRVYYVEPSRWVDGDLRTFDYKLLNVLIQGSASDGMKQAIINYDEAHSPDARMLLTLHDEIIANADEGNYAREIKVLGDCMTEIGPQLGCDVSFPTDAEYSSKNWASMEEYEVL